MKRIILLTILLLPLLSGLTESPAARANTAAPNLAAMPLMFIEQQPNRYQVAMAGQTMWLTHDSLWLSYTPSPESGEGRGEGRNIKLTFENANPQARMEPINRLETHVSYFMGNDPAKWQTDVPVYGGVRYHDLYPGQDLIITSEQGKLVWSLTPTLSHWEREIQNPSPHERGTQNPSPHEGGTQNPSPRGRGAGVRVSINNTPTTHTLDPSQSLTDQLAAIIDPQTQNVNSNTLTPRQQSTTKLVWSTFLGGSASTTTLIVDSPSAIALDSTGNVYVTGYTSSTDFPTTAEAYDTSFNGSGTNDYDVFVAKLNSDGTGLIFATFLGGTSDDRGNDLVIDSDGNAYVTGSTSSADFPVTAGAYDTSLNGYKDAFVAKLNSSGTALIFATCLGSNSDDSSNGIVLDNAHNIYLTGGTRSADFPTTAGAFDTSYNGGTNDVFVAKLNSDGTGLSYATFLGGAGDDSPTALAIDSTNNVYLTGSTSSDNFPVTAGAYDTSFSGIAIFQGSGDAFVVKLNSDGTGLSYATYLGGNDDDGASALALDSTNNVYLTGSTNSTNFPTTTGVYDTSYNGAADVFIAKLNSDGTKLSYATVLGGSDNDSASDLVIDSDGNTYVTGSTYSTKFPTTVGAFDTTFNGGNGDVFVARLNSSGTALSYATFLGGSNSDFGAALAIDNTNNIYVVGDTRSTDFPTTIGAYDTSYNGGNNDAFITKLNIILPITPTPTPTAPITPTLTPTPPLNITPTPTPTPFAKVVILGPTEATRNVPVAFTAIVSPNMSVSYNWSPRPTAGQGSGVVTYTFTTTEPQVIQVVVNNGLKTASFNQTVMITNPLPIAVGDAYEIDDACSQASTLDLTSAGQYHTFHQANDVDWAKFSAIAGETYLIKGRVLPDSPADLVLDLTNQCDSTSPTQSQPTFSGDVRLMVVAPTSQDYYVSLRNQQGAVYGAEVGYHLSIQQVVTQTNGALVLVAGKRTDNDKLQQNIYQVTDAVYDLAKASGCTDSDIYYLAPETRPNVDGLISSTTLQQTLTQWAPQHVGPDKRLTLYMMDHGTLDKFYLNGVNDTLTSATLDSWLGQIESTIPNLEVNVMIDACYSGSFIDPLNGRISRNNRLIMTSADAYNPAFASTQGAVFSDALLQSLQQGDNLYHAFTQGQESATQANLEQQPWLDVNGNGIPNETADQNLASQHAFACATRPASQPNWLPEIRAVEVKPDSTGTMGIWATVNDDSQVKQVWAIIIPPSYVPPANSETLVAPNFAPFPMISTSVANIYGTSYGRGFTEGGTYRVVVYAQDDKGALGQPYAVEVSNKKQQVYLPVIRK